MSPLSTRNWFLLVILGLISWSKATAADHMREQTVTVANAVVRFVLHPSTAEPSLRPQNVSIDRVPNPGDISQFVHSLYDYRAGTGLGADGRVVVVGTLWRRPEEQRDAGLSFLDVDKVIAFMSSGSSRARGEKVERNGSVWIKRTDDSYANIKLEWLVPLQEDLLLRFRVDLTEFRPTKTSGTVKWRAAAEELQRRIFESLRVN